MKPYWEIVHDHFLDRLKTSKDDLKFFEDLIIRHPGEEHYKIFLKTIDLLKKETKLIRNEYKSVYGFFPKPSKINSEKPEQSYTIL
jgi:hypothetical protein